MQKDLKLKCKPNVLEIYSFLMYHSFSGMAGIIRIGISLLFLGVAFATRGQVEGIFTFLLVLVGLLNPVVTPVYLYLRALRMEKAENAIGYELCTDEIYISQNGTRRRMAWAAFPLIVWGRSSLMLYVDGSHALLLPRRQMDGREEEIFEILRSLPKNCRVRLGRHH
ncbi:YcxB family protein [Blautia schinkii]|nr:YcxB family protein [Blautia schinkii]